VVLVHHFPEGAPKAVPEEQIATELYPVGKVVRLKMDFLEQRQWFNGGKCGHPPWPPMKRSG
jgi:hypothetical protein